MNEHNRRILLSRLDRIQQFINALHGSITTDGGGDIKRLSTNLERQVQLLLGEVDAAEDGC